MSELFKPGDYVWILRKYSMDECTFNPHPILVLIAQDEHGNLLKDSYGKDAYVCHIQNTDSYYAEYHLKNWDPKNKEILEKGYSDYLSDLAVSSESVKLQLPKFAWICAEKGCWKPL